MVEVRGVTQPRCNSLWRGVEMQFLESELKFCPDQMYIFKKFVMYIKGSGKIVIQLYKLPELLMTFCAH